MTKERAAKIILDLINAGEAEYINFSVEEIMAFKKAYVALNSEPTTNADRIRKWSDEEIAEFTIGVADGVFELFTGAKIPDEKRREMETKWLDWLKEEVKGGGI